MKFGAELNSKTNEQWRDSYIQYNKLKVQLKTQHESGQWTEQDEKDFTNQIETELKRVYTFVQIRLRALTSRIDYCDSILRDYKELPRTRPAAYDSVADSLAEILIDVDDLAKFHELNLTGFEKIVKKHDKWTGGDLKAYLFGNLLETYPLDKQRFDVLIVRISDMHDLCRLYGNPRATSAYSQGGDQTAFERATNKYWVHPDHITEVKAIILLHLPVHVFNQKKQYESTDAAVSSVYYDNEHFDLYEERLSRSKGAEAIRIRWYGQSDELNDDVYIERKTHHAAWLDDKSVKDRFRLKENQINGFVNGVYSAAQFKEDLIAKGKMDKDSIEENHFVAEGIQHSIKERNLKPMCRVFYNRTAFQLPGDQRLRISLDSNLTFIREDHLDSKKRRLMANGKHNWRRPDVGIDHPFRNVKDSDILRFPYAILETKIQSHLGQTAPAWLSALLDSHLVHEVPRFSKYIHGASYLFKDRVSEVPYWLPELEHDIRKPVTPNVGLSRSQSFKALINGRHRRSLAYHDSLNESTTYYPALPSKPLGAVLLPLDFNTNIKNTQDSRNKASSTQNGVNIPHLTIDFSNSTPQLASTNTSKPNTPGRDLISRFWTSNSFFDEIKKGPSKLLPSTPVSRLLGTPDLKRKSTFGMRKLDPKAFFANERTFISWLQFCALLLTVSLNLLNYGDRISRIVGACFIVFSSGIAM
jgi:SPX domain protein involved in polyphosphate accumulation